jgi:hypothetical protein
MKHQRMLGNIGGHQIFFIIIKDVEKMLVDKKGIKQCQENIT